ncbi:MAG: 3-hydroxyacyl-CoA dehydrogenase NAD-binding domain-containing protein [Firmicutes bacterium]|nr:3-hydroxyacyl-CoA dehydrogenase NAD-binding domain-containing protein [Bacillota bacterium]
MRVVIVGAGTMGRGIAEVVATSGFDVTVVEAVPEARKAAAHEIRTHLERRHARDPLAPPPEAVLDRIRWTDAMPEDEVSWVIEAVPESRPLKESLFASWDALLPPNVWLASNTSSIAISLIQAKCPHHPERVGGLHFFNPVPRMALVEIVRGLDTSDDFVAAAQKLVQEIGKEGIVVPDQPGFLVNRVARPYYLEALRMAEERVADATVIDRVMEGLGFPMGPFRLMDLVGLDINLAVTQSVWEQTGYDERYRPHPWQAALVARGALGRKTGRGFYRYD